MPKAFPFCNVRERCNGLAGLPDRPEVAFSSIAYSVSLGRCFRQLLEQSGSKLADVREVLIAIKAIGAAPLQ
ncbi:hypothetical protein WBP06_27355 [Novosphingobium sp. BL-8H]|uniref:hypothetical protein n=1 Tax=Novosphingobium sp. BL-8H TaxID=3127640 RepID=UPI003756E6FA